MIFFQWLTFSGLLLWVLFFDFFNLLSWLCFWSFYAVAQIFYKFARFYYNSERQTVKFLGQTYKYNRNTAHQVEHEPIPKRQLQEFVDAKRGGTWLTEYTRGPESFTNWSNFPHQTLRQNQPQCATAPSIQTRNSHPQQPH